MPSRQAYEENARIVISELFPQLSDLAMEAAVWLLVDFLMRLETISANMPGEQ
jgi:hypothetical protein